MDRVPAATEVTAPIVPLRRVAATSAAASGGPAAFPVSHVRKLSVYGHLLMLRRSAGGPTKVAGEAGAAVGAPAQAVRRIGASVSPAAHAAEEPGG